MRTVEFENVSKYFNGQRAVASLSFTLKKGEVVGFLGPNGAGKTTSLKMLGGLIKPSEGKIKVLNETREHNNHKINKNIGFLLEQNPLYYSMYVVENLLFFARLMKVSNPEKRVRQVIEMTALYGQKDKRVRSLSKGYRQRVGIAQALIHDPEILIMDEPINGLDPGQIEDIRQLFRTLGTEKTILYSTHILQEVEATCDRLLVLKDGRLVADTTPDRLKNERLAKVKLFVKFERAISIPSLSSFLGTVDEIKQIEKNGYEIICLKKQDVRRRVFSWAVKNNVVLLEMYPVRSDLHEYFLDLTQSL